jgi:formamidopyrimidine-DNA glycosylase
MRPAGATIARQRRGRYDRRGFDGKSVNMPELPEVETVRRGLAPVMEGATIRAVEVRRGDLRLPFPPRFAARLRGRRIDKLERRAKYLLAFLDDGEVLLMHLGMSGSFRVRQGKEKTPGRFHHPRSTAGAHDHVIFSLSSGANVTFNDPRRFGIMLLARTDELPHHRLLNRLGPEPLARAFDAAYLARACRAKKTSLKTALADQRVVAGLGNIYVCEALHRAHLSPKRQASTLADRAGKPNERAKRLVRAVKAVLRDAIKAGGSSLRDHRRTTGELGDFQHNFRVYDREDAPCTTPGCPGTIHRIVQAGRSTFFCPVCQR